MSTLGTGTRSNAKGSYDWLTCKVRKHDVPGIGNDGMRNAGFCAFPRSPFKLSDIFALDGDLGSADAVLAAIGESGVGILIEAGPQRVGIGVACLSAEFSGSHLQVGTDQRVNIELFFLELLQGIIVCLGQCGLTVLVNAKFSWDMSLLRL